MHLSNPKHQLAHRVHLSAVIQSGKKLRTVMIVDDYVEGTQRIQFLPFCLHSANCNHCKWLLSFYPHTSIGTLHAPTTVTESPFEMDKVPADGGAASQ